MYLEGNHFGAYVSLADSRSTMTPVSAWVGAQVAVRGWAVALGMSTLVLGGLVGCGSQTPAEPQEQPQAVCGDGVVDSGELCDGTALDGNDCTTLGEGYTAGVLRCNATCDGWIETDCVKPDPEQCGNGRLDVGELCDGFNLGGTECAELERGYTGGILACNATCDGWDDSGCTRPPPDDCGNNTVDPGELCDGDDLDGQNCASVDGPFDSGVLKCNATCDGWDTSRCAVAEPECQNNRVEGDELCDGNDLDGKSCQDIWDGYTGGTLACNATCDGWDESGCTTPATDACGNGNIDAGEVCDGGNLDGNDCTTVSQDFDGGTLRCGDDCSSWDTNDCSQCGNGQRDPGELCDGDAIGDVTCSELGWFSGGTPRCNATCDGFDLSSCDPPSTCGDGQINGREACDGVAAYSTDCSRYSEQFDAGALTCTADCTFDFSSCTASSQSLDYCTAAGWYGDAVCDACTLYGGAPDTSGCGQCAADGVCADWFDYRKGVWTCAVATGARDPDCTACGNGTLDALEQCDPGESSAVSDDVLPTIQQTPAQCISFFFGDGTLGCTDACTYDFSGCEGDGWLCAPGYYADGSWCHCGCGVADPDCDSGACDALPQSWDTTVCNAHWFGDDYCDCHCGAADIDCEPRDVCDSVPDAWDTNVCSVYWYDDADDWCDCGCGAPDKDCEPLDACASVPPEWDTNVCEGDWYDDADNWCDCGCGAPDPDCSDGACEGVPAGWTNYCEAGLHGDGVCDCNCGAPDVDCGANACN